MVTSSGCGIERAWGTRHLRSTDSCCTNETLRGSFDRTTDRSRRNLVAEVVATTVNADRAMRGADGTR